jgi:hypothetical protein
VNLRDDPKALVPVPLGECHVHRVGVERKPEHTGSIQKAPDDPTPPLAAHEPLEIVRLGRLGDPLAMFDILGGSLLTP